MKLITLLTDFTQADGDVAVMKGVILKVVPMEDPVLLDKEESERMNWADAFGDLSSNITGEHLAEEKNIRIILKNYETDGCKHALGNAHPGELVAMLDSFGYLGESVVNGSASAKLENPFMWSFDRFFPPSWEPSCRF